MEINEFNNRMMIVIDSIEPDKIKDIYKKLHEKGLCDENLKLSENSDISKIKDYVKSSILHRASIDDLKELENESILRLIQEFASPAEFYEIEGQPIIQPDQDESQEALIKEAIQILSQRSNIKEEVPKDLQPRLSYIITKLNIKYKISRRDIANFINLHRNTVNEYANKGQKTYPDLLKLWGQSIDNLTQRKIEDTISKQASDRAISTLKDNIAIGDMIREKFSIQAAQKGLNLYSSNDLEILITKSVNLFFSMDIVHNTIRELEEKNERLFRENNSLKQQLTQLRIQFDQVNNFISISGG